MKQYIGLDLSLKETAISVRQNGKRIWRGKCPSDPHLLAEVIRKRAPNATRVVFETGPLSVWFYHGLMAEGLPAICIDARHAKAALDMAPNKTDANDADGLAHLAEVGFYREVRVKQYDSMLTRTLVGARGQLIKIVTELSNQIRGLMKNIWAGRAQGCRPRVRSQCPAPACRQQRTGADHPASARGMARRSWPGGGTRSTACRRRARERAM